MFNLHFAYWMLVFGAVCIFDVTNGISGKEFREQHNCISVKTQRFNNSFVPHIRDKLDCLNVIPSSFWNYTCEGRCRNPVRGHYLSPQKYTPKPIRDHQLFKSKTLGEIVLRITRQCTCEKAQNRGKRH